MKRASEFKTTRGIGGHELLAHVGMCMAAELMAQGLSNGAADAVAFEVMDRLQKDLGGQNVYFPNGTGARKAERNAALIERWDAGVPIATIAIEFGVSLQWAYRLVADERAKRRSDGETAKQHLKDAEHARWKREN